MPTYDYECLECGHTFEHFQNMSDAPLTDCPVCQGHLRRLIGGGLGIIFKGSGFYVTDNKSAKQAAAPTADSKGGNGKEPAKKETSGPTEKTEKKKEQPVKT